MNKNIRLKSELDDVLDWAATQVLGAIKTREVSVSEVVDAALERAQQTQEDCNCFTAIFVEESREQARDIDTALAQGGSDAAGALLGLPIGIKDFTPTRGQLTTCGSVLMKDHVTTRDAVVAKRLKAAGGIVIGKTTTPEFAHSGMTSSPLWGATCNPWDTERSSGGSSGGSAVAVTRKAVYLAEGSDMGGSIRIPASFCGCVGLKPSKGRIPMDALDSVFDHISHFGPLARSVDDAALFLKITQGAYEPDIQSQRNPTPIPDVIQSDAKGLRLAVSPDLGIYNVDPEIIGNLGQSVSALEDAGAQVDWVDLNWPVDYIKHWEDYWGVFLAAQFGHHLEQHRDRMDPELVGLMEAGMKIDAVSMERGAIVRTEQWHKMAKLFETYDALICPTTAKVAPSVRANESDFTTFDENGGYNALDMTAIFNNVSVCPAIAVPNGFTKAGLPTSVQVVGHRFDDPMVLRLAKCLERRAPWANWQA